jgi:hypothetical protein
MFSNFFGEIKINKNSHLPVTAYRIRLWIYPKNISFLVKLIAFANLHFISLKIIAFSHVHKISFRGRWNNFTFSPH